RLTPNAIHTPKCDAWERRNAGAAMNAKGISLFLLVTRDSSLVTFLHMQQRVRLAHAVRVGATDDDEAHALVEADRLRVLFVDLQLARAPRRDGVRQQRAAHALPTRVGMHEQHFDLAAIHADEADHP